MNSHRLYTATQAAERALHHLRRAWMEQDGGFPKTLSSKQVDNEVKLAQSFLAVATVAADEAIKSSTPEEPPKP